jgi:thioredoxin 1
LTIEKRLTKLEGVREAKVNYITQNLIVTYAPSKIGITQIEKVIEDLGYRLAYKKYEGVLEKIRNKILSREKEGSSFRLVSDHEFEELVLKANKPAIVLFASATCPACRVLKPLMNEIVNEFQDKLYFYEMDTSTSKKWEEYNVMGVPTVLYFKRGQEIGRQVGVPEKKEVEDEIMKLLS